MQHTLKARDPLWTKNFVVSAALNIVVFLHGYTLLSAMALFAMGRFVVGDAAAGTAASIFLIGSFVTRPLAPWLMAKLPIKGLLYVCLGVFLLTPLLLWHTHDFALLLVERFFHGMAFGIASTVVPAITMSGVPRTRLAEGTSWYATSSLIGVSLGPVLGIGLMSSFGFETVVWVATGASILAVLFTLMVDANVAKPSIPQDHPQEHWVTKFISPEALPATAIILVCSAGFSAIVTYLGAFAMERDFDGSYFFLVYAVSTFSIRIFTGPLMDRRGFFVVLFPSLLLFAAALLAIAFTHGPLLLITAGLLMGIGYGNILSAGQGMALAAVPKHRIGAATGTFYWGLDAGIGLGPMVLGLLIEATNMSTMYIVMAAAVALVGIINGLGYWRQKSVSVKG